MRFDLIKVLKCHLDWVTLKYSRLIPVGVVSILITFVVVSTSFGSLSGLIGITILIVGSCFTAFTLHYYENFYIKMHALKAHRIKNSNLDKSTSPYYLKTLDSLNDASFFMFQEIIFCEYIEESEARIDAIKDRDYLRSVDLDICKDCGVNEQSKGNCPFAYCLACDKRLMLSEKEQSEITTISKGLFVDAHTFSKQFINTKEQQK